MFQTSSALSNLLPSLVSCVTADAHAEQEARTLAHSPHSRSHGACSGSSSSPWAPEPPQIHTPQRRVLKPAATALCADSSTQALPSQTCTPAWLPAPEATLLGPPSTLWRPCTGKAAAAERTLHVFRQHLTFLSWSITIKSRDAFLGPFEMCRYLIQPSRVFLGDLGAMPLNSSSQGLSPRLWEGRSRTW